MPPSTSGRSGHAPLLLLALITAVAFVFGFVAAPFSYLDGGERVPAAIGQQKHLTESVAEGNGDGDKSTHLRSSGRTAPNVFVSPTSPAEAIPRRDGRATAVSADAGSANGGDTYARWTSSRSSVRSASQYPFRHRNTAADFAGSGGRWLIRANTSEYEPVRHWLPSGATSGAPPASPLHSSRLAQEKNIEANKEGKSDDKTFRPWRRFDQLDALQCLSGRRVVLVGNSNTRTLLTALQSLLEGAPQMGRVTAKQQCDNSKYNHSCWLTIGGGLKGELEGVSSTPETGSDESVGAGRLSGSSAGNRTRGIARALLYRQRKFAKGSNSETHEDAYDGELNGASDASPSARAADDAALTPELLAAAHAANAAISPIHLHYVSYTGGLYSAELEERVAAPFFCPPSKRLDGSKSGSSNGADVIVMSVGLNFLQKVWDDVWRREHNDAVAPLAAFIARYLRSGSQSPSSSHDLPVFFWHTTAPLCRAMPQFRRYKYRRSNWQSRSLDDTNAAIDESNRFVLEKVLPRSVALLAEDEGDAAGRLVAVDGHAMLSGADLTTPAAKARAARVVMGAHRTEATGPVGEIDDICRLYDDPLHHRFFDRELVQVILNHYC